MHKWGGYGWIPSSFHFPFNHEISIPLNADFHEDRIIRIVLSSLHMRISSNLKKAFLHNLFASLSIWAYIAGQSGSVFPPFFSFFSIFFLSGNFLLILEFFNLFYFFIWWQLERENKGIWKSYPIGNLVVLVKFASGPSSILLLSKFKLFLSLDLRNFFFVFLRYPVLDSG